MRAIVYTLMLIAALALFPLAVLWDFIRDMFNPKNKSKWQQKINK